MLRSLWMGMVGGQKKKVEKIGHEFGIRNCIFICDKLKNLKYNIKEISFYVFSTENWNREPRNK